MKRFYFLFVFAIMVFGISSASLANEPAQKDEIEKTINSYVQSADSRDAGLLEKTLYSDAMLVTYNKITNKMSSQTSGEFVDQVKAGKAGGWKRNLEVSSVDGNDNVASAKVLISDNRLKQTGYLNLIKDGKDWKIVSGVFTLEQK